MLEYLKLALLAAVQGVAEFLPISSSGHLAVLGRLLDCDPEGSLTVSIVLHAGTLLAIVLFYFKELFSLLLPERRRIILLVIIGTIPAGIVGLTIKKTGLDDLLFTHPLVSGIGFMITATLLLYGMKGCSGEGRGLETMSIRQALLIGLAQAVAILPGVSRSGSTISAAMRCNIRKEDCATFSFLLAIPAIGGAAFLELLSMLKKGAEELNAVDWAPLLLGFTVSAIVGYFSLKVLLAVLKKGKLAFFSVYLYTVGTAVLIWSVYLMFKG